MRKSDFEKFGEISRFFFHRDAEGKFQGTACLFYKDPEVADKVMLLDGIVPCLRDLGPAPAQEYKGRALRVRRRQPRARKRMRGRRVALEPRYVAYLGINIQLEPELSWIARDARQDQVVPI